MSPSIPTTPHVVQLIRTTITRGTGNRGTAPLRQVTQLHSLEGALVAEDDPCSSQVAQALAGALERLVWAATGRAAPLDPTGALEAVAEQARALLALPEVAAVLGGTGSLVASSSDRRRARDGEA